MGQTVSESYDRQAACEAQRQTFKGFEEMGNKAGGILTIDYEYQIDKIEIAPSTREWGTVYQLKGDTQSKVRIHLGGLADPEKFFKTQ